MKKLFVIVLVMLSACTDRLDKKYSKQTFSEDLEAISKSNSLDTADVKILLSAAMKEAFENTNQLEGKTYRQIIADAKTKQAEQKALAERAAKEEAERLSKLTETMTVTVFEKGFYDDVYQDYILLKFVFENKSQKDIRAVTGTMVFTDLFDQEIKSISVTYDEPLKAKQTRTWIAQTQYNEFIEADRTLAAKKLEDLKIVWKPEKILFVDGSSLE